MDQVGRVGGAGRIGAPRARPGQGGFRLPDSVAAPPPVTPPAELPGLLALQEAEGDWVRDRPARRHAQAVLDELAALQRALLSGAPDPGTLARLANLTRALPQAVDARLAGVVRALAVRCAVELARRDRWP